MTSDEMTSSIADDEAIDTPPHVPEAFAIVDAASANWLVRKIIESRRYAEHVRTWAVAENRRAENDERFLLQRYGLQLERWVRQELVQRGNRRRSIGLPAGDVGFRRERPKLVVINETRLICWCREHLPKAVIAVEHVLKSMVHEHVISTGEVMDGAEIRSGGERFFIK